MKTTPNLQHYYLQQHNKPLHNKILSSLQQINKNHHYPQILTNNRSLQL